MSHISVQFISRESVSMKKYASIAAILIAVCCTVFCLCSCGKLNKQKKRFVDPETLCLMQKTQAELTACVERCRSMAKESKDKEILLALANSQEILANRHETIINILLKKYKMERSSTVSYSIEMNPRMIVLPPVDEYKTFLAKANPEKTLREVLIALEITNKVLESDSEIELMIDPNAEEEADVDFYLCPICGRLFTQEPEENCPVCHSDKGKIIHLKDGELPPRAEGTFVTVSE
jgi:rubrerythrin